MKTILLILGLWLAAFSLGAAVTFLFVAFGAPAWAALFVTLPAGWYLGRWLGKNIVFD